MIGKEKMPLGVVKLMVTDSMTAFSANASPDSVTSPVTLAGAGGVKPYSSRLSSSMSSLRRARHSSTVLTFFP